MQNRSAPTAPTTPPTNTLRASLLVIAAMAAVAFLGIGFANAFDSWSTNRTTGNCATCHGDFRSGAGYVSANDGVAWNVNLHEGHRAADKMLNRDCDACHGASRFPTALGSSNGGIGFSPIGCLGCHGRAEPAAGGAVTGAGLRQHHWRAGEQGCGATGCHADANPANFTTAREDVAPPYYFTPDAAHPLKPTSPCNTNGSESSVAPPLGLDNNGNGSYDGADPTCATTAVDPSSPLALTQLESVRPNPSFGRVRVTFLLASGRPATLEMLDISGRRVLQHEVGPLGAGRHSMDLVYGRGIAPGVYLVRLRQDDRILTTTAIVRR